MLNKFRFFLERNYAKLSSLSGFINKLFRLGFRGIRFRNIFLVFRGFYLNRAIPYNFNKFKPSDYISDFEQNLIGFVNHPYNKILNNKILFSTFFQSYFKTPLSYCLLNKGTVSNINSSVKTTNIKDIFSLLYVKEKLMLKPIDGRGGSGILFISARNKTIYIDDKVFTELQLEKLLGSLDNCILTEFVEQGKFTKEIFPNATNTLRIITMIDHLSSQAFIPIAVLRIGTSISQPVDNFPKGGIFSYIDVKSGMLSEAVSSKEGKIVQLEKHPETGIQIAGKIIPKWDKIIENLLQTSKLVAPFLKIVGWDVIVTNDGFVVIEGNSGPDVTIQGMNFPLAKNPQVLNFLKHNNIR